MKISIEGNIGSGKSTLLKYIKNIMPCNMFFVDEPVLEWQSIKNNEGKNALELFYENQKDNAFWFQILAYITRLKKLIDVIKTSKPDDIIIMERSIETDKNVFAKLLYQTNHISSIEWETYNYWYNSFSDVSKVDLIIYIKTSPVACYERIHCRNRTEEQSIPLDYLIRCNDMHDQWINSIVDSTVITIDGQDTIDNIRRQIDSILHNLIKPC